MNNTKKLLAAIAGSLMWSLVALASALAGPFGDDNHACPADRPCFNEAYQSGDQVIFRFTGVSGWEFYNLRYTIAGGGETQVENRSGTFTFTGVQSNRVYTLKVQGCNSHTLARSTCSPWSEQSVTTEETYYRLQLKQGGKYLDAVYCSDKLALSAGSTYAGGACQLWRLVPAGGGWSRLQLKQSGKYLDAVYCSDQVALNPGSTYASGACELWRLVPAGDGWSRLQLKQSGKYLDAVRCTDTVALNSGSTYAGGACQLWRLVDARH
jgi:hypothetical protein